MSELVDCIRGMVERGWLYLTQTINDITFVSIKDNETIIHFRSWDEVSDFLKEESK